MPPLNVIEPPIVAFGDDRCQGIVGNADLRIAGDHPAHHPVGHSRHVQRICEGNRILQESGFAHPGKAGHLTGSIEDERPGRHFLVPHVVARDDDGHAGSHRANPWFEWPVAGDEGCLAHRDAGHVGNRVERSRVIGADDDAKSTSSHSGLFRPALSRYDGSDADTAGQDQQQYCERGRAVRSHGSIRHGEL